MTPPIRVRLVRRPKAPTRPSRAGLARLFARAWRLTPGRQRPCWRTRRGLIVDVIFAGDAEMAALNAAYRGHAGPTDVLSFPMEEPDRETGAFLLGEVAAGFETAAREAAARRLEPAEELARYAVHGFLHLLGFDDATAASRRALERVQERALAGAPPRRDPPAPSRSRPAVRRCSPHAVRRRTADRPRRRTASGTGRGAAR